MKDKVKSLYAFLTDIFTLLIEVADNLTMMLKVEHACKAKARDTMVFIDRMT